MISKLARVTILVRNEDEALQFYTETLGFEKRADLRFGPGFRWLTVAPKGHGMEAAFQDLYGNPLLLLQPSETGH